MVEQQQQISASNLARLQWQEAVAARNGFTLKAPIYALGTPVIELGRENFRKSRQAFSALPTLQDAVAQFTQRIRNEQRRDMHGSVKRLTMSPEGAIVAGSNTLLLDDKSFDQLMRRTDCPEPGAASTYLALLPAARRANEVNSWLSTATKDIKLRTRVNGALTSTSNGSLAPREVYACVSERYEGGYTADVVARLLAEATPGDARCEIQYNGRRFSIRLHWHSNVQPEQVCAGEVFRAFAEVSATDDGTASLEPRAGLTRNLCLNLLILDEATISLGSRRHVGGGIDEWLASALRDASSHVKEFAEVWDRAVCYELTAETVRDIPADVPINSIGGIKGIYRGLMADKRNPLTLPSYRGEDAITALFNSFDKEHEFSRAGIVNGITRAAHELSFPNEWAGDELECAAAPILKSSKPFQWLPTVK